MKILFPKLLLLVIFLACSCQTDRSGEKKRNPWLSLWLPFSSKRVKQVYNHSLVQSPRFSSDCDYSCPDVDVWQYQYKDTSNGKIISSDKPISTQKKNWKSPDEARIIAVSLFGEKEFYYNALVQYVESFSNIKNINNIKDPVWGYETFTMRVYVAKRNPKDRARLGEISNETPEHFISHLLDKGCEIAFVDNKLALAKMDGTFWRFAVTSEMMRHNERVRYLLRDADNIVTAAEMYAVADWIRSGKRFHRMHLIPICIGPLTAMLWGGSHTGAGDFQDFHDLVKNYPYRFQYGDDELFSRDLLWPRMKSIGSILTHRFEKSRFISAIASPYANSCEEPTDSFCKALNEKSDCVDITLPDTKNFGGVVEALGLRVSLEELVEKRPEIFDLELEREDRRFVYDAFKSK